MPDIQAPDVPPQEQYERARARIVKEMEDTEATYCEMLKVLKDVFIAPMKVL